MRETWPGRAIREAARDVRTGCVEAVRDVRTGCVEAVTDVNTGCMENAQM